MGYYFYASPKATKNRKVAAKWATDMKSQVMKAAKQAKKVDRATIEKIVMSTAKTFEGMRVQNQAEVQRAAKELKANWQELVKELGKDTAHAKKAVKKAVKTTTKVAKKAVKKMA